MSDPRLQTITHRSPLGRWSVSVWTVDPRLRDVVTTLWFGAARTAYRRDRILPSGQSQLPIDSPLELSRRDRPDSGSVVLR